MKKAGHAVGNFFKNHGTDILVGVAICATGCGIAGVAGYSVSACLGGVVVAGAGSIFEREPKPNPHIPAIPIPNPKACSETELAVIQQGIPHSAPNLHLPSSLDEMLVIADGIWANGQFFPTDGITKHSTFSPAFEKDTLNPNLSFTFGPQVNDWKTFHTYLSGQQEMNGFISYQALGEKALIEGNYNQAVLNFGKAIETNPIDPLSYLRRGAAQFELQQYESSLEDYQKFAAQTETPDSFSVSEFCLGFTQGLSKGTYESGEGILLFLVDFVKSPIQTSKQTIDSITALVDLVRKDEWGTIAGALSPEVHQLVTQWDTLPSKEKGELAGYAVGKHGADILMPGALAKVASKSVKSAQELVEVCRNLQIVQETLVLETAAGIGNSVKIAEVIEVGQKTASLADELGFTAREIGQLKQGGQLEATVAKYYEHSSLSMQESIALHKKSQEFLKPYAKKPMPEITVRKLIHETGIPTFPRPKGIPEDFLVMVTDKGAGMEYVHPTNTHIRVRVMSGKLHSPNPRQQKPYVIQKIDRGTLDEVGKCIASDAPEAHIPIEEFIYRNYTNGN